MKPKEAPGQLFPKPWTVPAKTEELSTEFPKWKYHATEPARIVNDQDEEDALGAGWHNTPVKGNEPEEAPQTAKRIVGEHPVSSLTDTIKEFLGVKASVKKEK